MKWHYFFATLAILFTFGGCASKTSDENTELEEQMRATQLTMDVRVFDLINKGDTNAACKLLAIDIDHNITQLEAANKDHPLDKASSSLFQRASEYRKGSAELNRLNSQ